jgi:hypothetical protein
MNDFFASFYEKFYYATDFSLEMFERYLYQRYAVASILGALAFSLIYYFPLDRPKFAKRIVWLIMLLISSVISAVFLYNDCKGIFEDESLDFPSEAYSALAFGSFILTTLLFILLSLLLKKLSKNVSKIPF